MAEIPVGIQGESTLPVSEDIAINFLGIPEGRVLGTPYLILHLEMAARNLVKPLLGDEYDSVGTIVNVRHLAATPLGMNVTFRARVTAVSDRKVQFAVEAYDEKEKVAEGEHERAIVNIAKFTARVTAKSKTAC
jgi:fluoroacetyl-CoA thioesterase